MSVKVTIWGDIYLGNMSVKDVDQNNIFTEIEKVNDCSDLAISNFEAAICDDENFQPIIKTGPNMKMSSIWCDVLKRSKMKIMSLANNHVGDYGEVGVRNTIQKLRHAGIETIGAGNNLDEAYSSLHLSKDSEKISIIAVCENEFGVAENNKAGVAGFDEIKLLELVKKEKEDGFFVIILFHGGMEFCPIPSPYAIRRYRKLIEYGASIVAATHTHCPQGYEKYKDGFITYSLGNLVFHDENRSLKDAWNRGYGIQFSIKNGESSDFNIIPYCYDVSKRRIYICRDKEENRFNSYLNKISSPIKNQEKINDLYVAWCMKNSSSYTNFINNGNSGEIDEEIENLFRCESHRERMLTYYKNRRYYCNDSHKDVIEELLEYEMNPEKI